MLVVSEIAEALEGLRKNLKDDHLKHREMVEVELADALIRTLDFAGGFSHNLSNNRLNLSGYLDNDAGAALFQITAAVTKYGNRDSDVDFIIDMILSYAEKFNHDIWGALEEKNTYNQTRKDHSVEARLQQNGKRF